MSYVFETGKPMREGTIPRVPKAKTAHPVEDCWVCKQIADSPNPCGEFHYGAAAPYSERKETEMLVGIFKTRQKHTQYICTSLTQTITLQDGTIGPVNSWLVKDMGDGSLKIYPASTFHQKFMLESLGIYKERFNPKEVQAFQLKSITTVAKKQGDVGDWQVIDAEGNVSFVKNADFRSTYEAVDENAKQALVGTNSIAEALKKQEVEKKVKDWGYHYPYDNRWAYPYKKYGW